MLEPGLPLVLGRTEPASAPPVPIRSLIEPYREAAAALSIELMPHQDLAARYLMAVDAEDKWLYREIALVMARQNGKTEILLPRIKYSLSVGRRILHTAQNRVLPRETFMRLAALLAGDPDVVEMRFANGQELIRMSNGGKYTLVAPKPSARGYSVDEVYIDEVREAHDFSLIAAIKPTLTASRNPQIVYLSNAGDEDSLVLNDLKRRADVNRRLCYVEWSANPERAIDEVDGWAEANPALGRTIMLETLLDEYESLPAAVFETEHLCRWVVSMRPKIVNPAAFDASRGEVGRPSRPAMGVGMDADGSRAAACLAWRMPDGRMALRQVAGVSGEPIDADRLGADLNILALRQSVIETGYDDLTDRVLADHIDGHAKTKRTRAVTGREFANACETFVRLIEAGRLVWDVGEDIASDLPWAARRSYEQGAWIAVKAKEDRPIPALLAAIRAVWVASGPTLSGAPTIR